MATKKTTKVVKATKTTAINANSGDTVATATYAVVSPFKFRGIVVKPGTWLELAADEAAQYQDAEVLAAVASDPPVNEA